MNPARPSQRSSCRAADGLLLQRDSDHAVGRESRHEVAKSDSAGRAGEQSLHAVVPRNIFHSPGPVGDRRCSGRSPHVRCEVDEVVCADAADFGAEVLLPRAVAADTVIWREGERRARRRQSLGWGQGILRGRVGNGVRKCEAIVPKARNDAVDGANVAEEAHLRLELGALKGRQPVLPPDFRVLELDVGDRDGPGGPDKERVFPRRDAHEAAAHAHQLVPIRIEIQFAFEAGEVGGWAVHRIHHDAEDADGASGGMDCRDELTPGKPIVVVAIGGQRVHRAVRHASGGGVLLYEPASSGGVRPRARNAVVHPNCQAVAVERGHGVHAREGERRVGCAQGLCPVSDHVQVVAAVALPFGAGGQLLNLAHAFAAQAVPENERQFGFDVGFVAGQRPRRRAVFDRGACQEGPERRGRVHGVCRLDLDEQRKQKHEKDSGRRSRFSTAHRGRPPRDRATRALPFARGPSGPPQQHLTRRFSLCGVGDGRNGLHVGPGYDDAVTPDNGRLLGGTLCGRRSGLRFGRRAFDRVLCGRDRVRRQRTRCGSNRIRRPQGRGGIGARCFLVAREGTQEQPRAGQPQQSHHCAFLTNRTLP